MENNLFYDLVRVALGNQECLSRTPTAEEWAWLLEMAEKQAVDGITYSALEVLTLHGQKPTVSHHFSAEQGDGYLFHRKTKSVIINS